MENVDRRFTQSILHEYGPTFDDIPSTYILPGLREYREENHTGTWIHDFRASWQMIKILKLSFIVNNVFNVEYMARPGDIRPPRMFIAQLALKV